MTYQIDFLPVGDSNGDAICVRYGTPERFYVNVVDGGFTDTAETVISHIRSNYGAATWINNLVLSHADNDHACGLIGILKHFKVDALWMNRPWIYAPEIIHAFHGQWTVAGLTKSIMDAHPYLVELEALAAQKNVPVYDVFQGAQIGQFTVLAPSRARYVRLLPDLDKTPPSYLENKGILGGMFETAKTAVNAVKEAWNIETLDDNPPATSASNETSVVQLGILDGQRALLTADIGPEGLMEALNYALVAGLMGPLSFVQIPHHGSRRNVTPTVLNAWLGKPLPSLHNGVGTAFCSVGKDADIYPRKKVKNAFIRRGFPVHATRGAAKMHNYGWPRERWVSSVPEPFAFDVED